MTYLANLGVFGTTGALGVEVTPTAEGAGGMRPGGSHAEHGAVGNGRAWSVGPRRRECVQGQRRNGGGEGVHHGVGDDDGAAAGRRADAHLDEGLQVAGGAGGHEAIRRESPVVRRGPQRLALAVADGVEGRDEGLVGGGERGGGRVECGDAPNATIVMRPDLDARLVGVPGTCGSSGQTLRTRRTGDVLRARQILLRRDIAVR